MSKFERNKDLAQEVVSSAAEHVGEIATDAFEMREAAQRAEQDRSRHITDPDEDPAAH
ncbi:Uncharacterised protein [Mycobacteroides abscessus]|nr:Uncharacterised protein [Mycobacteroides abscessus]